MVILQVTFYKSDTFAWHPDIVYRMTSILCLFKDKISVLPSCFHLRVLFDIIAMAWHYDYFESDMLGFDH